MADAAFCAAAAVTSDTRRRRQRRRRRSSCDRGGGARREACVGGGCERPRRRCGTCTCTGTHCASAATAPRRWSRSSSARAARSPARRAACCAREAQHPTALGQTTAQWLALHSATSTSTHSPRSAICAVISACRSLRPTCAPRRPRRGPPRCSRPRSSAGRWRVDGALLALAHVVGKDVLHRSRHGLAVASTPMVKLVWCARLHDACPKRSHCWLHAYWWCSTAGRRHVKVLKGNRFRSCSGTCLASASGVTEAAVPRSCQACSTGISLRCPRRQPHCSRRPRRRRRAPAFRSAGGTCLRSETSSEPNQNVLTRSRASTVCA